VTYWRLYNTLNKHLKRTLIINLISTHQRKLTHSFWLWDRQNTSSYPRYRFIWDRHIRGQNALL